MLEGKNKQVQNKSKYLAKSMCESRDSFIYLIHKCIGQCVEIRKIIVFWIQFENVQVN